MTEITRRKNCKFRKAKGQIRQWCIDHKKTVMDIGILIIIIWVAITLLMWGFTQKTVTVHQCENVTDKIETLWYHLNDTGTLVNDPTCISEYGGGSSRFYDPPCHTNNVCNNVSHKEYYSLIEIFGQQLDIIGTISGIVEWVFSHPVV